MILKNEGGSVSQTGAHVRVRKMMVAAQIALSLLLLFAAGLFGRSLQRLFALNPGFRADHLLTFSVDPSLNGYSSARNLRTREQIREDLERMPSVISVSAATSPLIAQNNWMSTVRVEGYHEKEREDMNPEINSVGTGFFATTGIALTAGREFTPRDAAGAPGVAIINQKFAAQFFNGRNPLGSHLYFGERRDERAYEIVGVAKDAKSVDLRTEIHRMVYLSCLQDRDPAGITYYVRTSRDPELMGAAVLTEMRRIDPNLPIFNLKTLEHQIDETHYIDLMVAWLASGFGALATLLAAVGLYGVVSFSVTRRTREIGIRIALGAERRGVLWIVMREVLTLSAIGIAAAIPAAFALGRVLQSQLFELKSYDPVTIVLATLALVTVAFIAGLLPARRASRIDPVTALRYE